MVTGGAGDLGFAAARALLEHGLHGLMIFDRDAGAARAKIAQLDGEFPDATIGFARVDVLDATAIEAAVAEAARTLGSIDVLCCFAGMVSCSHAVDLAPADWDRVIGVNTTDVFLTAQAVARVMRAQGTGGSMIFVASVSAHRVNYPQPQVS